MSSVPSVLLDDDVAFDRDLHAYTDTDGARRMSVTQSLAIGGLFDYSMVPAHILERARLRGVQVHQACALIDRGEPLDDYVIPDSIAPRIEAYHVFLREMKFIPDPDWVERPMIVELFGHRVAMTPDVVGMIAGVPTLIERKTNASDHPGWALQTAGYDLGLKAAGLQIRQRFALRLLDTARYRLIPHEERGDYDSFGDFYRSAAWKLKNKLAFL